MRQGRRRDPARRARPSRRCLSPRRAGLSRQAPARAAVTVAVLVAAGLSLTVRHATAAEWWTVGTRFGSFAAPAEWAIAERADEVTVTSPDSATVVRLSRRPIERVSVLLARAAAHLGISGYVRSVARDYLDKVGAQEGRFVLGTVPVTPSATARENPGDRLDPDQMLDFQPGPAEYVFIVAYRSGRWLYVMECRTSVLPDGPDVLSEVQRSWRLPR